MHKLVLSYAETTIFSLQLTQIFLENVYQITKAYETDKDITHIVYFPMSVKQIVWSYPGLQKYENI